MCLSRSNSLILSDNALTASFIPIHQERITEDLTKITERFSKGKDSLCVDTRIQSDTRRQLYMTPKRSPTQVDEYDLSPPPVKRGRLQPRYYEVNEFSSVHICFRTRGCGSRCEWRNELTQIIIITTAMVSCFILNLY